MAFVRFTNSGKSFSPRASLGRTGLLGLNDGARRKFDLDQHPYCALYYDAEQMMIGIELLDDNATDGAQKIRLRKTGADIAIKSFIEFFAIEVKETTLYGVTRDESTGYLVIDMKNGRKRGIGRKATESQCQVPESVSAQ